MTIDLNLFWGKAQKEDNEPGPSFHSAVCHMIDVGLVAARLLECKSPAFRARFFREMKCPEEEAVRWIAFFVACHDIGKVSPGFQKKVDDLAKRLPKDRFPFLDTDEGNHGQVTFDTLPDILQTKAGCKRIAAIGIAHAAGAHHGSFHLSLKGKGLGATDWPDARAAHVETLREAFGLTWDAFPLRHVADLPSSFLMALAGLASVADWIGSDKSTFGYTGDETTDFTAYARMRRSLADRAVRKLHLDHSLLLPGVSPFADLFDFDCPNSCQQATLDVFERLAWPALLLIETPMGTGKTEAALAVVERLIRSQGAFGMYYALPTQATGNQMFERVEKFLENHPARNPSELELHLLHGNADLNEAYSKLKIRSVGDDDRGGRNSVTASSWFARRKHGLLAPFAVGTVDQALFAALQCRHMFVRLYGLADKVVVIDEVHAYDTYTSEILDRLLMWLGALDVSVILLSATLPAARRRKLLQAYAPNLKNLPEEPYPRILAVNRRGQSAHLPVKDIPEKSFRLELIRFEKKSKFDAIEDRLKTDLAGGGCAACIVNSVDEAQELFSRLRITLGFPEDEFILFHARFPLGRRIEIEERIKRLFGKGEKGDPNIHRPKRAVVVATQVIEQSLDVDFDVMVTDLAPIDLVLQRAGRLQRHERPRPANFSGNAVLYCLTPELTGGQRDFGISGLIYAEAVLLRTATTLEPLAGQSVTLPDHVEELIERVYGGDTVGCREDLVERQEFLDFMNRQAKRLEQAQAGKIVLPKPDFDGDDSEVLYDIAYNLDDETAAPLTTRLTRPSVTIIVLHRKDGRAYLDRDCTKSVDLNAEPDLATARELVLRGVTLNRAEIVRHFLDHPEHPAWTKSPQLKFTRPAIFIDGKCQAGKVIIQDDETRGIIFQ